jgi:hypothetical protein
MISGRALALLFAALFCAGTASGQIIEVRTEGGKTFTCARTGLSSSDCGARSNWYSYVFVGSISAITPIENDEKEIQVVPEEVFFGKPATPLTVLTSAALCLPNLAVGDSWLFFLRQEKDKPIVLDYYGNDSLPVVNASKQIETLRRLLEYWRVRSAARRGLAGYLGRLACRVGRARHCTQGKRWHPILL